MNQNDLENTPSALEKFHEGHRVRMRKRFWEEGFRNFSPHEVVEFLLFFTRPRVNTNETAHMLIKRFGNFSGLLDASKEELMEAGLSEASALLFKAIPGCFPYYFGSRNENLVYDNIAKLKALFAYEFPGSNVEQFRLACFTPRLHLKARKIYVINDGEPDSTEVNIRKLVYTVVHTETNSIALSHTHPHGPATPSTKDIATTRYLGQTLRAFGVNILDHIIIGTDGALSMREAGCFTLFE
jgi:DNA repair protein RadC